MAGELVQLWVYDLSGGLARMYSQMLLGKQIEAIYHTSIVVGGLEHFFGGGINVIRAGMTPFGRPMQVLDLGYTQLPEEVRAELLAELSERYTPQAYSLFHNNCNSFSSELAQLLCGKDIPAHITGLPSEVLSTPFGQMIAPMMSGLEQQLRSMRGQAVRPQAPAAPAAPATAAAAPQAAAASSVPAPSAPAPAPAGPPSGPLAAKATAEAEAEPATEPAAAPAGGQQAGRAATAAQQQQQGEEDGSALHAAEVEIEAAVAAGMMQEAEQSLERLHLQPGQDLVVLGQEEAQKEAAAGSAGSGRAAPGFAVGGATPAVPAEQAAKLAAELEVATEFRRILASVSGVAEHEAQAQAMEAVAARRRQQEEQAKGEKVTAEEQL